MNEKYARHGQTVLFGDSITEIFNSYKLFYAFSQTTGQAVYNRGISGDTSDRLLERLECNALNINPKNLVILIGTNDIGIGVPTEYTLKNIRVHLEKYKRNFAKNADTLPEYRRKKQYSGIKKPRNTNVPR